MNLPLFAVEPEKPFLAVDDDINAIHEPSHNSSVLHDHRSTVTGRDDLQVSLKNRDDDILGAGRKHLAPEMLCAEVDNSRSRRK